MSASPLLLGIARSLVEFAGLCLLGQGLLHVLAGQHRAENPVYQLFRLLTQPLINAMRCVTPAFVSDKGLAVLTFILLFAAWIGLSYLRHFTCLGGEGQCAT